MTIPETPALVIERDVHQAPDAEGHLFTRELALPAFQCGIYYRPYALDGAAGNRVEGIPFDSIEALATYTPSDTQKPLNNVSRGQFAVLKLTETRYLALLPMACPQAISFMEPRDGSMVLVTATFGSVEVQGDIPLFASAYGQSPYEATHLVWKQAIESGFIAANWRHNKPYPEVYEYLGWCSWEHFKWDINEENMCASIRALEASDAPYRWAIIDDGYLTHEERQILTFDPDSAKFPNGWTPLTAMKHPDRIKWMGIWRNFLGYMRGISPEHRMDDIAEHLVPHESPEGLMHQPEGSPESSKAFYDHMVADSKANGFDFTKVDFQSRAFDNYAGRPNPVQAMRNNNEALENACHEQGIHLLNCIAQTAVNSFQTSYSALTRSGEDYCCDDEGNNKQLTHQCFANNLWMGQTVWTDFDEFHSYLKDTDMMSKAHAISGGPVYTSDEPEKTEVEVLCACCDKDGKLFRTLAPATLLPDSLFDDPYRGGKAMRVMAPLPQQVAAIGLFNLTEGGQGTCTPISPADYPHAGELLLPYEGPWESPAEGLLLYDCSARKAARLTGESFQDVPRNSGQLYQLHPIQNGWAVIGRIDKYLPAAAVTEVQTSPTELRFTLREGGPFAIWSEHGAPQMPGVEFEHEGGGLYTVVLEPVGKRTSYCIRRGGKG